MLTSVVGFLFGKKLLGLIDGANTALTGYRSDIIVGVVIVVAVLEHIGLLPAKTAEPVITALLGALPITLAEKAGNILDEANKVLPNPPQPTTQ